MCVCDWYRNDCQHRMASHWCKLLKTAVVWLFFMKSSKIWWDSQNSWYGSRAESLPTALWNAPPPGDLGSGNTNHSMEQFTLPLFSPVLSIHISIYFDTSPLSLLTQGDQVKSLLHDSPSAPQARKECPDIAPLSSPDLFGLGRL